MKILVTGATGYLGGHVASRLAESGHQVLALARSGREGSVPSGCRPVTGDVLDPSSLHRALEGCDALVHMAALVKMWVRDRREFDRVNVEGLVAVLRAAERRGIRRILYTSTIGALGPTGPDPCDETHERTEFRFRTDYERTKWLAERVVRERVESGLPIITVYPGVVYGAGARTQGNLLDRLFRDYVAGRMKVRLGRAPSRICYALAADVAEGHRLALDRGAPGRGYILGGENASQDELFGLLHELTGLHPPRWAAPFWAAEAAGRAMRAWARLTGRPPALTDGAIATFRYHWAYSSDRAVRELGYRVTPLREGLRATLSALRPVAEAPSGRA
ncbi:MAG TPA: NAD-dependent epimerase/dehydratase family protein [Candidatus Polarisedimenticolia bacterium]|nr:NAD-dependent epimerase/dehydratase family protein [Candidatus Polarisedimenticolia bacterium]